MKKPAKKEPLGPAKSKKKERAVKETPKEPETKSKWQEFLRRHSKAQENNQC